MEICLFLDKNHGLTPLEKCQILYFLTLLFLQPRTAFFRSRISWKTLFWPLLPKKKKVENMAIFGQKQWVNPLGKMTIFWPFKLFFFYSLELRLFVLEYRKSYYPGPYCLTKKSWKYAHFLDKNHGLTPLEKCQFLYFLNLLFLQTRTAFLRSRIS